MRRAPSPEARAETREAQPAKEAVVAKSAGASAGSGGREVAAPGSPNALVVGGGPAGSPPPSC